MRRALILAVSLLCALALAAGSEPKAGGKPPAKPGGWWETPTARPAQAAKSTHPAAPRRAATRARESKEEGPAIEPLRWPGRDAGASRGAKWVIEL